MTEQEFLKFHSGYYGEEVDHIGQIVMIKFTGEELLEYLNQALSMSGVSDSVPCDYRKDECTNDGKIINGVWRCSNHQGTDL